MESRVDQRYFAYARHVVGIGQDEFVKVLPSFEIIPPSKSLEEVINPFMTICYIYMQISIYCIQDTKKTKDKIKLHVSRMKHVFKFPALVIMCRYNSYTRSFFVFLFLSNDYFQENQMIEKIGELLLISRKFLMNSLTVE